MEQKQMHSFVGRCHCGNLELTFSTEKSPEKLGVRACACDFCRRHGTLNTTAPQGKVHIIVHEPSKLNKYSFGLLTADFLICRECGVYLGAIFTEEDKSYASININTLDKREVFSQQPVVVNYENETKEERRARRKAKWTPVQRLIYNKQNKNVR